MSDAPSKRSIDSTPEQVTLAVDTERAEAILHDIAVQLTFVGLTRQGAALHGRALALKRDVVHWAESAPAESQRLATIQELLELHERVKEERRKQR